MSDILCSWCHLWVPNGLTNPTSPVPPSSGHRVSILGRLLHDSFLSLWMFPGPGIWSILWSLLSFRLYLHSFMWFFLVSFQELKPWYTLPSVSGSLQLWYKTVWPQQSSIFHACKTRTTWMTLPAPAVILSWSQLPKKPRCISFVCCPQGNTSMGRCFSRARHPFSGSICFSLDSFSSNKFAFSQWVLLMDEVSLSGHLSYLRGAQQDVSF